MIKLKSALLTAVVALSPFAAASAFAGHYEIWNGTAWVTSGSVNLSGATTATVVGVPVPCSSAVFTLTIPGSGSAPAQVTGATFGTSSACTSITKVLPWNVSAPSPTTGSGTVTISSVSISFTSPPATCTGSISGPLTIVDNPSHLNNSFTFSGSLGACTNVKSNPSLTANKPIRWVP